MEKRYIKQINQHKNSRKNFHKAIIAHKEELLEDIENRNQGRVAKELNLTPTKMSTIVAMLRALL